MGDGKIVVIDRESLRKESKSVLAAMGLALMESEDMPMEVYKVIMEMSKTVLSGLEIQLFGKDEEKTEEMS